MPFDYAMPADVLERRLECALYWKSGASEGSIAEVGYKVFSESHELEAYIVTVDDQSQEAAAELFASDVIPHLRRRYGLTPETKEPPTHEPKDTQVSSDRDREAAPNEPGRPPRVPRNGRKQKQAGSGD